MVETSARSRKDAERINPQKGTETMRRWTGFLAALSLLAAVATGCHHTAGVCDCDLGCHDYHPGVDAYPPVAGGPPSQDIMPPAPVSYHPETLSGPAHSYGGMAHDVLPPPMSKISE